MLNLLNLKMIEAGSINEAGTINNWNKQGFTFNKAGSELISNSIDAFSENIWVVIKQEETQKYIDIEDDGVGMTTDKFPKMFDLSRENHALDKSMGVAGIGGFLSLYKLSHDDNNNPTPVEVSTKHKDGPYLKAFIPFDEIYKTKKFYSMIEINEITDGNEINKFNINRVNDEKTGTTIRFVYSQNLYELLKMQFVEKYEDIPTISSWWSVVFGKFKTNIVFDKKDGTQETSLKKYDYFSGQSYDFYKEVSEYRIYYLNEDNRYVTLDPSNFETYIEIPKDGRGFGHKPKPTRVNIRKIEISESFILKMGMRKHNEIFNIQDPSSETIDSANFILNSYDEGFMKLQSNKDKIKDFISKTPLIRNGQKITDFMLFPSHSLRASGDALAKGAYHRSEIEYEVYSSQENKLDQIFNIQQNKNQNQNVLPIPLLRLIQYLKDFDYDQHKTYFKEVHNLKIQKLLQQQQRKLEKKRLEKERKEQEERERNKREERERLEKEERERLEKEERERNEQDDDDEEELIQEVKKEIQEVKEEIQEVKEEIQEVKEELIQEVKEKIQEVKEKIQEVKEEVKEVKEEKSVNIEDFEQENAIILSEEEIDIALSLQYEREAISIITSQINNPSYKRKNGEELLNMIKKFYNI